MSYAVEHAIALAAVRQAAAVCRSIRDLTNPSILKKGDASPVTVADFASQAIVCRALGKAFPGDPIIAEESSKSLSGPDLSSMRSRIVAEVASAIAGANEPDVMKWIDRGTHASFSGRYWTLDPVDGTKGFLRGDQYAVALALIENGTPVVACLACPALAPTGGTGRGDGIVYSAILGGGTRSWACDDSEHSETATVGSATNPADLTWCESVEPAHSRHEDAEHVGRFLGITSLPIRMDSQAKYALVARGDASYYLRLPAAGRRLENIWDHAAGCLVVQEAGGKVTDLRGRPLDFRHGRRLTGNTGILASSGSIHDTVLDALNRTGLV